jgi:hypothetical protein
MQIMSLHVLYSTVYSDASSSTSLDTKAFYVVPVCLATLWSVWIDFIRQGTRKNKPLTRSLANSQLPFQWLPKVIITCDFFVTRITASPFDGHQKAESRAEVAPRRLVSGYKFLDPNNYSVQLWISISAVQSPQMPRAESLRMYVCQSDTNLTSQLPS